ncbi:hypothetical protein ABSL26_004264 [Yersinia enterocolitica]|nr:hypothetical protein [Yersinia enterocolitica]HDL7879286.1 hypothetical protein [Yersinia enterocolitica]HDL7891931.1 hypothetical protein [Yersinia enterocolitica]HDM8317226.1 hypothetical protein [Yersinia enterocolitica]HEF7247365.1 hypothetical protein [Yersinia enterocolitica]
MEMKSKEFRKLSKDEKKAFKKAGGKVKFSSGEKIFIGFIAIAGIGWLLDRHAPAESPTLTVAEQQQTINKLMKNAQTNCMLDATHHIKIPDSFKRTSEYLTMPMTDKTGYVVTFKFTAKNALGVDMPKQSICKTDNAGKVIKSSFS